jgi:hypothetical protein
VVAAGAALGAVSAEHSADTSKAAAAQDKPGDTSRSTAATPQSDTNPEPGTDKTPAAAPAPGPDATPGARTPGKSRPASGPGEEPAAPQSKSETSAPASDTGKPTAAAAGQEKAPAPTKAQTSATTPGQGTSDAAASSDSPAAQQAPDAATSSAKPAEKTASGTADLDKPSAIDAKTALIPRPGSRPVPGSAADEHKTVAIPRVSPVDAETTVLPVQATGAGAAQTTGAGATQTTEKISKSPDRPVTPRPAGAPSPADVKPTVPAELVSESRTLAPPQRVPPAQPADTSTERPRRRRRRLLVVAAAAVVVAVIAVIVGVLTHGSGNSPSAQVRSAVTAYTNALADGNLADLRNTTCGQLHDFYQNIAPDQYAGVHKLSADQKKIPKVSSIDTVQITGDKAVAQANIYTDSAPNTVTARTFDLQQTSNGWKVCDPPSNPR